MEKRFDQKAYRRLLTAVEGATGKQFSAPELDFFARGADEIDLVNSGLEESMSVAFQQIRRVEERLKGRVDMRTAAMVLAIEKIVVAYKELGLFP
jgi:glutamate dehydrogenase (NAD(P)+)